eukprot:414152-Pelagomonas_calceolata.AAC.8
MRVCCAGAAFCSCTAEARVELDCQRRPSDFDSTSTHTYHVHVHNQPDGTFVGVHIDPVGPAVFRSWACVYAYFLPHITTSWPTFKTAGRFETADPR